MNKSKLLMVLAAFSAAFGAGGASARVGVASVVEGEPLGVPPNGVERILRVGIDMSADEKVTTGANDRAHLVFLDGTSLTVGPNSTVLIDKFVFDPQKKNGEMALTVGRGTMRFVGGVISKTSEVRVKTPSASIGIRGGIFTVTVSPTGQTTANFLYGASFTVTSQGVTQTTSQPGQQVVLLPPAAPPGLPPGALPPPTDTPPATTTTTTTTTNTPDLTSPPPPQFIIPPTTGGCAVSACPPSEAPVVRGLTCQANTSGCT